MFTYTLRIQIEVQDLLTCAPQATLIQPESVRTVACVGADSVPAVGFSEPVTAMRPRSALIHVMAIPETLQDVPLGACAHV